MTVRRLYTWVDVQRELLDSVPEWPEALHTARVYWDAMVVTCALGRADHVRDWIRQRFDPLWDDAAPGVVLETARGGPRRVLAVQIEEVDDPEVPRGARRRTFRAQDPVMRRDPPVAPPRRPDDPVVMAWHSFKGGVGRTTSAIVFARLLARRPEARVLLVDLDFEAPGISWMAMVARMPAPAISMADIVALIHGAPERERVDVYGLIADRLRDTVVDDLVVLPAFRPGARDAEVLPEHLEQPGVEPILEVLHEVARALHVTHVVVDLRAGRSEISASLLLDPRVHRVLVTTPAGQSLRGTEETLRDLARADAFPHDAVDPAITVVASKLIPDLDAEQLLQVRDVLGAVAEDMDARASDGAAVRFAAARHDLALATLPLEWDHAVKGLDASAAFDTADLGADLTFADWVQELLPELGSPPPDGTTLDQQRERLATFAGSLVTAEGTGTGPFLDARFLRQLVQAHRGALPVAVAEGAKGSGKTFTFLRMVAHGSWAAFANAAQLRVDTDGIVVPLVWSKNLKQVALGVVGDALGGATSPDQIQLELVDALDEARRAGLTGSGWRRWWVERMAWLREVAAVGSDPPPLFVVDGLEDLLPEIHSRPDDQACLRALLQDVPAWIRANGEPIGLIVFARSDYVRAAIPQNTEQFRAQYSAYRLRWDRAEALRLVAWTAKRAEAVDPSLGHDDALRAIWGRKLGTSGSREGMSNTWIMDALTTRKEEVQARDLVRLMAEAARRSEGWPDRLLAPYAIRDALEAVGSEKIKEIVEERPDLGNELEHFRTLTSALQVPFRVADLPDDRSRAALLSLEAAGIAWKEGQEYWIVSLYRRGLGLRLQPKRRERVLR